MILIKYENKVIGKQKIILILILWLKMLLVKNFLLFEDIEKIKKLGLAKGGSLENAVVVDKDKVLNSEDLETVMNLTIKF